MKRTRKKSGLTLDGRGRALCLSLKSVVVRPVEGRRADDVMGVLSPHVDTNQPKSDGERGGTGRGKCERTEGDRRLTMDAVPGLTIGSSRVCTRLLGCDLHPHPHTHRRDRRRRGICGRKGRDQRVGPLRTSSRFGDELQVRVDSQDEERVHRRGRQENGSSCYREQRRKRSRDHHWSS